MKFVSFCSGKGGVGKTALACSAAVILARDEKRVLLFDGNLALPNCDLYSGVDVGCTIGHVVRDSRELRDAVTRAPAGFDLISGGSGWPELAHASEEAVAGLIAGLHSVASEYDHVLIDLPAGVGPRVFPFLTASDAAVLVLDGGAASIIDGYALVRTAWTSSPDLEVGLVVNRVACHTVGKGLAKQFQSIVGQYLSKEVRHWATVREDSQVGKFCDLRRAFAEAAPLSPAAQDLIDAVNVIEGGEADPVVQTSMLERLKSRLNPTEDVA